MFASSTLTRVMPGRGKDARRWTYLISGILMTVALQQRTARPRPTMGSVVVAVAAAASSKDFMKRFSPAARFGGHSIWADLEGWRRNKRDIEDRLVLASRRAAASRRQSEGETGPGQRANNDEDFAIDDGDEDAWVHDGVDDIHIDPETKRAASELSRDEANSIEAEYDPNNSGGGQESESPSVVNRTRVTTISEVIPMSQDDMDSVSHQASSRRGSATPWTGQSIRVSGSDGNQGGGPLLPASYLTLEQVQRLIDGQRESEEKEDD